jgi:subtilisin family serine protease
MSEHRNNGAVRSGLCAGLVLFAMAGVSGAQAQCLVEERVSPELLIELTPYATIETILVRYDLTLIDSITRWNMHRVAATVPPGADPEPVVDALAELMDEDPDIDEAEAHRIFEDPEAVQVSLPDLGLISTRGEFRKQPATLAVKSEAAHQRFTGAGVTVAVIDTGMSLAHPETASQISATGADFAAGDGTAQAQANGLDDDEDGLTDESLHHGTFVAGLVNLIAPDAVVLPVRTLDAEGRGSAFSLAKGIQFAVDNGADVISLSESMLHGSRPVEQAIEDAIDANVVVVVAAGNRGLPIVDATVVDECRSFPATHPEVIAVAAMDSGLAKADFSDYGPDVHLGAPGVDIVSTYGDTGFGEWDGTSFAAPIVAGAAALLLEKYPGLTPLEVRDQFMATAQPDNNPPEFAGMTGAGVLDADALTASLTSDRSSVKVSDDFTGTTLSWSPVLSASHYDVARGDVANLRRTGADEEQIDLGPLTCIADALTQTDTAGIPDGALPAPGQVFFYVFRDDAPGGEGGGSYGVSDEGDERIAGATDCPVNP